MIRGGDGKMKGKRSHRHRGWMINRAVLRAWRSGAVWSMFMNQGPMLVQWSAAEDHTKW